METNPLKLYVRLKSDACNHTVNTSKDQHEITLIEPKTKSLQKFEFYRIFPSETSQEEVFHTAGRQLVDHVIDGFDSCIIAYGATGSGKSYNILGGDTEITKGLLYRAMEVILDEVKRLSTPKDIKVEISMCELYQEQIRDLGMACINQSAKQLYPDQNLEIIEQLGRTFVKSLEVHRVSSISEVYRIVNTGLDMRRNIEEEMGMFSNKAYTVYIITISQKDKTADWDTLTVSSLYIVDCAGNERPTAKRGREWAENISISNSFATLGKVLTSLRAPHIPYRDSKLTKLIQNSLRSDAMISFIATVDPSKLSYDKTLADFMAHALQRKPATNSQTDLRLRTLQDERAELKEILRKLEIRNELQLTKIIELLGITTDIDTLLQSGQSSKEIQKIQKHKEAMQKIDATAKRNKELERKIEENKEIFERIKKIEFKNEEKHVRRVLELKDEISNLQNELEETKSGAIYSKEQQVLVRNDELHRMLAHSHILLEEKSNIVENIPTECVETLKVFNSQDMKTIGREELVREFDKRFQEQKVNHDQQLQNVQEQFENFIAEKEKTLAQMVDEFKSRRDRNK
jgi:hypothetical protein